MSRVMKESRFLWIISGVCPVCFVPLSVALTQSGRVCGLVSKVNIRSQIITTLDLDTPPRCSYSAFLVLKGVPTAVVL
jgi:hypothetical protein